MEDETFSQDTYIWGSYVFISVMIRYHSYWEYTPPAPLSHLPISSQCAIIANDVREVNEQTNHHKVSEAVGSSMIHNIYQSQRI